MSSKNKGGGQEGALVKILERQKVQKTAVDVAKKLKDTTKEAKEKARVPTMKLLSNYSKGMR